MTDPLRYELRFAEEVVAALEENGQCIATTVASGTMRPDYYWPVTDPAGALAEAMRRTATDTENTEPLRTAKAAQGGAL